MPRFTARAGALALTLTLATALRVPLGKPTLARVTLEDLDRSNNVWPAGH